MSKQALLVSLSINLLPYLGNDTLEYEASSLLYQW